MKVFLLFLFLIIAPALYSFDFVILKYKMGDWYNSREGVKNFLQELKDRTLIQVDEKVYEISLEEDAIFEHSFLFLNGHVPVVFSEKEIANLRKFVLSGGFVFVNDDYGMDESFRKSIKEFFPEYPLQEVNFKDPIYHCFYDFKNGIPKIHEHDGGPAKAFGVFIKGRMVLYYAFNTDIADGWDPPEVHNDPSEKREEAFKMGVNIVYYSLTH